MRYYNRDARTSACRLIRKRKGSRAEGGGERRGRWPMWKQCGKKQQRVEEEARSLRSFMEYVNWHRHPDLVPFQPVNRMVTNCDRINEGLYYEDLISVYIN